MKSPMELLDSYPAHEHTLASLVESRAAIKGATSFMRVGDRSWDWDRLPGAVEGLAAGLVERGVAKGDRLAIVARNSAAHVLLLLAAARIGAIMVPVNPDYTERELAYILGHCSPSGIFCSAETLEVVRAALGTLEGSAAPWLVAIDESPVAGLDAFDTLIQTPAPVVLPSGDADDTCVIIYTSGTTGFPKGVMHSQRTLVTVGEMSVSRVHLQSSDRLYIILPLFHINALFYSLLGALAAGASVVIKQKFSASQFWDDIMRHGITQVNVLESVALILAARPRAEFRPGHAVRVVYGVRPSATRTFIEEFHIPRLVGGYGMSEIPGFICNPYDGLQKPGSMGLLASHPDVHRRLGEARVVDDSGTTVVPGQVGELQVKTPVMMQGYFRDEAQTRAAFIDGWFLTGDLVRQDEDGYFFFIARKKDLIRRRGENISAAELDRVLSEHPDVAQAAVAAVPSEMGDDEILAALVLKPDRRLEPDALAAWCATRMASQKIPRYISFVTALPLNATHKVLRKELQSNPFYLANAVDISRPAKTGA